MKRRMTVQGQLVIERDESGTVVRATTYDTALYIRRSDNGQVWATRNDTKYSATSSKHYRLVQEAVGAYEWQCATPVRDVPRGATCEALGAMGFQVRAKGERTRALPVLS